MLQRTLFVGILCLLQNLSGQYSLETVLNAEPPIVRKLNEFNESDVSNDTQIVYISYLAAVANVPKDMESLLTKLADSRNLSWWSDSNETSFTGSNETLFNSTEESNSTIFDILSILKSATDSTDHDNLGEQILKEQMCFRMDFDGSMISGALKVAIDEINANSSILPNHQLRYIFENTCGDEKKSTKYFMDHWARGAKAFFGPEMNCRTEAHMAAAQNLPIISYKCKDTQVSDKKKYGTFARTVPADSEITKAFISFMKEFGWKLFTVVYEDTAGITEMFHGLRRALEEENSRLEEGQTKYTILNTTIIKHPFSDVTSNKSLESIFEETKDQTRIYVTFGNVRLFRAMLRKMGEKGMMQNQEHLLIYLDPDYSWDDVYRAMNNHFIRNTMYTLNESWDNKNSTDRKMLDYVKSAFAIIPTPSKIPPAKLEEFWRKVDQELSTFGISKYGKEGIDLRVKKNRFAYYLYDAVHIYARALHEVISAADTSHGYDPVSDGRAIMKRIFGRKYPSIQGYEMMIDKNGDANGNYSLLSLQSVLPIMTSNTDPRYYPMNKALDESGIFVSDQHGRLKLELTKAIIWENGVVPKDQPECGFNGERCLKQNNTALWVVLVVILIVMIGVSATALFAYRSQKFEKDLQSMWKIHASDLQKIPNDDDKPKKNKLEGTHGQITQKSFNTSYFVDRHRSNISGAMYKGGEVFVKKLHYNKSKDITRQMKLEMLWMVRLGHPNINKFMGICMQSNEIRVVREKCQRGSLMDALNEPDIISALSPDFIHSFINDIIKGMTYLHGSDLKVHGNLKSTNCLITLRWQVQLADFGLNDLRTGRVWNKKSKDNDALTMKQSKSKTFKGFGKDNKKEGREELLPRKGPDYADLITDSLDLNEKERKDSCEVDPKVAYWENLMWTAPELLVESNFGQAGYQPTQKGDSYAFGIILHEIAKRNGPHGYFEKNEAEREFIYAETLVRGVSVGQMPRVTKEEAKHWMGHLNCMAKCIEQCLSTNPEARPDFRTGIRKELKAIIDAATALDIGDLMTEYQNNLEATVVERTHQLYREQERTNELLHRMLPRSVAGQLLNGQSVTPLTYPSVTIYFSDIVGFTRLSGESSPMEVVQLLNALYLVFDNIIKSYDVYKVETIGDAYMVVSGIATETKSDKDGIEPEKQSCNMEPWENADAIARMAIHIRGEVEKFVIPHRKDAEDRYNGDKNIRLRIGIHTGPCVAGVVGKTMPRYCLFGDTVNTASRMESTGLPNMIHCSEETRTVLYNSKVKDNFLFQAREPLEVKGKGKMTTYFLEPNGEMPIPDIIPAETTTFQDIIGSRKGTVEPKGKSTNSWGVHRTSNQSLSGNKDPSSASAQFRRSTKLLENVEYSNRNGGTVSVSCASSSRELASVNEEDSGISNISSDFSRPRSHYPKSHTSRIDEDIQRKRSSSLPDCEKIAEMHRELNNPISSISRRNTDSHSMESIESENPETYPSYHDLPQRVTRKHGMGFTIWPERKRSLSVGDNITYFPSDTLDGGPGSVAQSTRLIPKSKRQRRRLLSRDRKSVTSLQMGGIWRDASPFNFHRMRDASPKKFFGSRSSRSNTPENGSLCSLIINEPETPSRSGSYARVFYNKLKFGSKGHDYENLTDDEPFEEEFEPGTSGSSLNKNRSIKTTSTNSVNDSVEPLINVHPELMV